MTESSARYHGAFRTQSVSPPERIWGLTDCCMSSTDEGTASELVQAHRRGTPERPSGIRAYMQPRPAFAGLGFCLRCGRRNSGFRFLFSLSPVRTTWPATRPTHSFFKLRAYPLNVLPPGFRFLYGGYPADPFIACEWRNILPFCTRSRVRNEDFP